MKAPRKLTPEEIDSINMVEFTAHHNLREELYWEEVLGKDWVSKTNEEDYERYNEWFMKRFTKLGRALK